MSADARPPLSPSVTRARAAAEGSATARLKQGGGHLGAVKDLTDADVATFVKQNPNAVLDLWAPWCKPCLRISPVLEEIDRDYAGKVAFGKINTDENSQVLARYNVMGLPAILVFKNGTRVDHITGFQPKPAMRERLDKALAP